MKSDFGLGEQFQDPNFAIETLWFKFYCAFSASMLRFMKRNVVGKIRLDQLVYIAFFLETRWNVVTNVQTWM